MRMARTMTMAWMVVGTGAIAGHPQTGDARATEIMAQARKALGGEQKLGSLKALSLRGSYRREMSAPGAPGGGGGMIMIMGGPGAGAGGGGQMTGDLEIDVAWPDKYIKVETGTGGMGMTRTEGFEGDRPFMDLSSNQPGMRLMAPPLASDPTARQMALKRSNEELARLLLGVIGGTQPSFTATYTYGGQAESPDGKADVIDVKGGDAFNARLFLDAASHLPLMITYIAPEPRVVMRSTVGRGGSTPPPATTAGAQHGGSTAGSAERREMTPEQREELAKAMRDAEATPPKMIEYRIFFADFRDVNGINLPHQITRGTADKTTEEWEIKSYKVNPSLKADRFKVGS
jgi:hypothetical protein